MVWFSNLQVGTSYLPALHNSAAGEKQDRRTSSTTHERLVQYRRDWRYTNRNLSAAIEYPYQSHGGPSLWLGCPILASKRRQLAASTWSGRRWSPASELRPTSSRSNLGMTFGYVLPNRWRFHAPLHHSDVKRAAAAIPCFQRKGMASPQEGCTSQEQLKLPRWNQECCQMFQSQIYKDEEVKLGWLGPYAHLSRLLFTDVTTHPKSPELLPPVHSASPWDWWWRDYSYCLSSSTTHVMASSLSYQFD